MKGKMKMADKFDAQVEARPSLGGGFSVQGNWHFECWRDGVKIWEDGFKNLFVEEGLENILDVTFSDLAQDATHYIGLKASTGGEANLDTLASHAGWTENSDYTGNRVAWQEDGAGVPTAKEITNSTSSDFTMDQSTTVWGGFLCSVATGTGGVLHCVGDFTGGSRALQNNDVLKVTLTITAADA